ncbi:MAG: ribosome biogenesis GTPase YlqF [Bacilli bacterium]|nr:ribosome biogenesis GTPase YlqF [Bacilli bacterium]
MSVQWFPGHMAKARNEIIEKIKVVDIVYVLLDARIPYSSSNPMINEILSNKKKIYILTKSDMADSNVTKSWEKHFKDNNIPTLIVDSISGINIKKIEGLSKEVLKEKIEKDLSRGMKMRPIRAMIVGIPNVGKSTLINRLVNKKVTNVGNKPGVTKAQQWIRINQNIELLDTPGVLWPKFEDEIVGIHLALTGAIKDEVLKKEELIFYLLKYLRKYYPSNLAEKYKIDIKEKLEDFDCIEYVTTFLKKYNIKNEDYDRVYDMILNDFKNARIGKISLDRV